MAEIARITPQDAHQKVESDSAILVCAYEDEAKFKQMQLKGAISLNKFKSRLPSLKKDQEIIFYCT